MQATETAVVNSVPAVKGVPYLGLPTAQDVHHDLHHRLVHPQRPHEVRVLVEHFIIHDVPAKEHRYGGKHRGQGKTSAAIHLTNRLEISAGTDEKVRAITVKPQRYVQLMEFFSKRLAAY